MSRANAIDDVEAPEDDMDAIANNDVVRFPFSTPAGTSAGASSGLGAALPAAQKAAPERARPAASTMPSDLASIMPLIGKAEGRGKNPLSSATGPFQIINDNFVNILGQEIANRAF
jgi:hypothetical protein